MLFRLCPLACRALGVLSPALAILLAAQPAAAHAILVASQPPIGGRVAAGHVTFDLHYNSRVDRTRSRLVLIRPDHSQNVLPIGPDGTPDELRSAATLTPGACVLRWQVLAIDGHITRGDVPFTVTGP